MPDLRGRVPVGYDITQSEFNDLGKSGGSKVSTAPHTHNIDHNHPAFNWSHNHAPFDYTHDHAAFATGADGGHSHNYLLTNNAPYSVINASDSPGLLVSSYTENGVSGAGTHQHGIDVPSHTGSIDVPEHTGSIDIPALGTTASGASSAEATSGNLQPYTTVNYIIKA